MLNESLNTKEALNRFAKHVIAQSKANLTRQGKRVNSKLYNSLKADLNVHPNSFSLTFDAADYAEFVDKGVSGTKKKYDTPFSYTNKMPPVDEIIKWVRSKRLRLRDDIGRFRRARIKVGKDKLRGERAVAFIVARNIKRKGS